MDCDNDTNNRDDNSELKGWQVYFARESESARRIAPCVRRDQKNGDVNSVFGFAAAVGQIEDHGFAVSFSAVVFVEDRLGHYILFASPISQVALAAAFAAKWKIRMYC